MALYVGDTSLLLHGGGVDGSTVFTDETGKTVTPYGNAHISTAQSKFGGSSMFFDGSGDFVFIGNHTDLMLETTPYTIEAWIYPLTLSSTATLVCRASGTYGIGYEWSLAILNSTTVRFYTGVRGFSQVLRDFIVPAIPIGAWTHVAIARYPGASLKVFVNGAASVTTSTNAENMLGDLIVSIGAAYIGGTIYDPLTGYIDDLRIVKGAALYTTDFTPPTAPLDIFPGNPVQIQRPNTDPQKLCHFDPSQVKPVISEVKNDLQDRWPYGPWKTPAVQWEFKGRGRITGTVAEKALPVNTPLRRLVRLHREPDGALVQATWSDATTGVYTFNGVRPDRKYFVTSFDYTNTYRAVIADNLSPTAL